MGKAGEKQKRRPKIKDKKQSERFKKAARELGVDQPGDAFDPHRGRAGTREADSKVTYPGRRLLISIELNIGGTPTRREDGIAHELRGPCAKRARIYDALTITDDNAA